MTRSHAKPFRGSSAATGSSSNTEQRFGLAEAYALACRSKRSRVASFTTNRGSSWSHVKVSYDWRDRHETIEFANLFATALGLPEVDLTNRAFRVRDFTHRAPRRSF